MTNYLQWQSNRVSTVRAGENQTKPKKETFKAKWFEAHEQKFSNCLTMVYAIVALVCCSVMYTVVWKSYENPFSDAQTRQREWLKIWGNEKRTKLEGGCKNLHHVNGFDALTEQEFSFLTMTLAKVVGLEIENGGEGMSVLDLGAGAGAFTLALRTKYPNFMRYLALDYAEPLVEKAMECDTTGAVYMTADITDDLAYIPPETFDLVISFSVLFYLGDEQAVARALDNALRAAKPGAQIVFLDISDKSKQEAAEAKRKQEDWRPNTGPTHLWLPKSFFYEYAENRGLKIRKLIDESTIEAIQFYHSASYRFSILFEKPAI